MNHVKIKLKVGLRTKKWLTGLLFSHQKFLKYSMNLN
nr:MAG TPA: hypothetical protein [Caudoviricetes sp.]